MTTLERVGRLLERRLEIDVREMTPERTLESLGIDSLAAMEMLFDLEDEFKVILPHDDEHTGTLGDVVALIDRELARPRARAA